MTFSNTAQGVYKAAVKHGAKWPLVVVAQWHLESAKGTALSAQHNYFGLKTNDPEDGQLQETNEEYEVGNVTTEKYYFKNFDSLEDCVEYLVRLWYKDYKGHKGVNRAKSNAEAAELLKAEGYATDSRYVSKLKRVMSQYNEEELKEASVEEAPLEQVPPEDVTPEEPQAAALVWITARQDTFLKKQLGQASALDDNEKLFVEKGKKYPVQKLEEVPANAHAHVELGFGAGTWYIYKPHWSLGEDSKPSVPSRPTGDVLLTTTPDWSNFSQKITKNLTVGEVLQFDSRRAPVSGSWQENNILEMSKQFQYIRDAWGSGIGVTSFYRPEPINQQVGGVPGSQHTRGTAIDVYPTNGQLDEFYKWLWSRWTGALGDGRSRGFIHIDMRGGSFVPGAGRSPSITWLY